MRVLVTGAAGQLGQALILARPAEAVLHSATHASLDIADAAAVDGLFRDFAPELVINAAAFTKVDDAERAPEAAARANSTGPAMLAAACRRGGAWLTHVSTDYVFDGTGSRPYGTDAPANPLNVYGRTKLAGETAVLRELPQRSTVVRASWLYSAGGGFAGKMLSLMPGRTQLSIVSDQIAAPTCAAGFARVLWTLSVRRAGGLWHWCDSGVASWYDFAVAIAAEAVDLGLLPRAPAIAPIAGADYPTLAARPPYSLLDKRATEQLLGITAPHWRSALRDTLAQAPRAGRLRGCAP
ncbi:MAG TPA: dTDP-4-dehydrorhamnose reductase [Steroidobacteraceae bacterium]|nr:dTDP-4-dehydrorhamnose reductase [Steroidobacteraceae bacterium]